MKKNTKLLIIVAVVAVLLVGVMLLLIFLPNGFSYNDGESASFDEADATILSNVDSDGVHQAEVKTDSDGKAEVSGALMDYVPADISEIHIENSKGTLDITSYTPTDENGGTEETVYTIKGYEDYDLQAGNPDLIASSAASLTITQVVSNDKSRLGEFGLDKPKTTVTVTYTDKTKAIIYIGGDAPQGKGTYVKFGDGNEVFVVAAETAEPFEYGLTDMISLTINDAADNSDNSLASKITLSGKAFPQTVVLERYTGENSSSSYVMTSPEKRFASESESSLVDGAIRGLYANSVVMVNPSENQLSELGLAKPYAELSAVYPDTTVELQCSKPDAEGSVYVMIKGGKVVYSISVDKLAWSQTSYEKLLSEYVLYPKMSALTALSVETDGKTYGFTLSTKEVTTTDDDGEDTTSTVTTVHYGEEEIDIGEFSTFYDALTLIESADAELESAGGGAVLSVTYTYSDGTTDKVSYYASSGNRYIDELNGKVIGHAYKAGITNAVGELKKLTEKV